MYHFCFLRGLPPLAGAFRCFVREYAWHLNENAYICS